MLDHLTVLPLHGTAPAGTPGGPSGSGFSALLGALLGGAAGQRPPTGNGPAPNGPQVGSSSGPGDEGVAPAGSVDPDPTALLIPVASPALPPSTTKARPPGLADGQLGQAALSGSHADPGAMAHEVADMPLAATGADTPPTGGDAALVATPATPGPDRPPAGTGAPEGVSDHPLGGSASRSAPTASSAAGQASAPSLPSEGTAPETPSTGTGPTSPHLPVNVGRTPPAPPAGALPDMVSPLAAIDPALAEGGIDVLPDIGEVTRPADRGSASPEPSAAAARPSSSPAASQIEVHLARAAHGRIDRLVVQLEPIDLGRVEIRLEFGEEGRVGAIISAERPETLEALQRDSHALERSLRDAGLRPDDGGLSFDLSRGSSDHRDDGRQNADGGASGTLARADEPAPHEGRPASSMTSLRLLDIQA